MRKYLAMAAVLIGLLAWHGQAQANCRFWTYTAPDGRMMTCTTCCTGTFCNTTCN